ncbi:DHA2 family efflux MFS transporter permease subunit [Kordiimonas pumila]|uniref:DHA2 family efflux MFS transporter permease subunit n=1 Tax=Kordiimonas pumila TaxID=2161677 RepID=A0ABV7D6U0_9PROT|nr:DHA2 family efflux MFS transporter permease subunit [Kordiimonas pumila]
MSANTSQSLKPSEPEKAGASIAHHRIGLVCCLMTCVSLHTIDATIVNVALPMMQGSLQATFEQISWVVTTYILASVVLTPLVGWASSRFGVKRLLIISVSIFTLSSVLCGLAITLEAMLAARTLQGASGAPLIPLAIATLNRLSDTKEDRAKFMALFGLGTMVGPVLGPSLGGYITDISSWRWVFFINLPVGILAVIGLGATMKAGMRIPGHKLNIIGFLTLAVVIGTFQLALDRGESEDWFESYEIIAYFLIAASALWMFIINSKLSPQPFLPPELFRNRNFMLGMFLILVTAGNMTVAVVLQPPMMQNLMGYGVLDTGVLLMWRGVGMMLGMLLAPRLSKLINLRILIGIGGIFMVGGIYPFIFLTAETPAPLLSIPPIFHGFGLGMMFVMASTTAYATIPHHLQVDASSVFSLFRGIGQSISISVVISMVSRYTQINHAELVERLIPYRSIAASAIALPGEAGAQKSLALSNLIVQREAAMIAYNNAYILLFIAALSVIVIAFFIKQPKENMEPSEAHPVEA